MNQQQRFVQSTQWLRPVTRWATRFSLNSPQWLPAPLRHAPLRLTSLVLKTYHRVLRESALCGSDHSRSDVL